MPGEDPLKILDEEVKKLRDSLGFHAPERRLIKNEEIGDLYRTFYDYMQPLYDLQARKIALNMKPEIFCKEKEK